LIDVNGSARAAGNLVRGPPSILLAVPEPAPLARGTGERAREQAMAKVDGVWEVVTQTPMGEQRARMTIVSEGDTFTGSSESEFASFVLENGRIVGDEITWTMQLTVPMKLTLEGRATIEGDTITGKIKAGFLGSSTMTGHRVG